MEPACSSGFQGCWSILVTSRKLMIGKLGPAMSVPGRGCVKTCTGKECAELFSLLASPDSGRQRYWFSNRRNRDGISTRKFCVGVFTQPGSKTEVVAQLRDVCSAPDNGHAATIPACPKSANFGRSAAGI